jgi:erythromycin esterase
MRSQAFLALVATAALFGAACHSKPPAPPPAPTPLTDSAAAALRWVQAHASTFTPSDSLTASASERAAILAIAGNARVFGFSELTEGTHEYPLIIRRTLFALADSGFRALAIQAPMAEAMEVDRYVRTGVGDEKRLLRALGSWRWETREMQTLVAAMRDYNKSQAREKQLGFYGFEIPSAAHAVQVVTTLPDSLLGASLKAYLVREYSCVAMNEGAHWGLEGRAADSTFWTSCGPATAIAADSVAAWAQRMGSRGGNQVAFANEMAQLIKHHVAIGLRHLKREEGNAEHVLYLANLAGPNGKLMVWGGDVEMAKLTLGGTTIQTAVPLSQKLGDKFRNVAFAFGDGTVRARVPAARRGPQQGEPGLSDAHVIAPRSGTYEDVLNRANLAGYWLDVKHVGTETGTGWLRGPHEMRLITEVYSPLIPQSFETPVEFPNNFDALVFVNHVTPAKQ